MLEKFIRSINTSNLREIVFGLVWDVYMGEDIASMMDIPAWEPIDDALCAVASRTREEHSERKLSAILSVVGPQTADLGKVKLGALFAKFREEGSVTLEYFADFLPPVGPSTDLYKIVAHRTFRRVYTPRICP